MAPFGREFHELLAPRALDDAKIRVSWGITGNEQIGNYDYLYSYATGDIYDGVGGVYPAHLAVDNLRWEETRQVDVGLDLSFFNSRLTITADYYDKYTDGLLANRELPKESGFSTMRTNVGEVSNRGFEFSIAGDLVRTKDFRWNASFNISRNWNTVEKLAEGEPYLENDLWWMAEGGSIGDFYGYKQINIFPYDESNAFTPDTWQQLTPVFENGSFSHYTLDGQVYNGSYVQKKLPNGKPFPRRRCQLGGVRGFARRRDRRKRPHDHRQRAAHPHRRPEHELHLQELRSLRVVLLLVRRADLQLRRAPAQHVPLHLDDPVAPRDQQHDGYTRAIQALYPRPYNDEYNNARYANSFYVEDSDYIRLSNVRLSTTCRSAGSNRCASRRCKSTSSATT